MNVNIGIIIAILFVIGIILDAVIVKIVGKNLPQESERTQENQPCDKPYRKYRQPLHETVIYMESSKQLRDFINDHLYYVNRDAYHTFSNALNAGLQMSKRWQTLVEIDKRYARRDEEFFHLEEDYKDQIINIENMRTSGLYVHDNLIEFIANLDSITKQMQSLMILDNDDSDAADTGEPSPKQEIAKTIEEMREISTRQLNTKEGDQEIAKLCHDIVVLFDEWENAIDTGTIDEFVGEVESHLINLVTLYQNALQGQGSFQVVLDSLKKTQSVVSILAELAEKRLANKNAISTGMGLDQLKIVAYNALSLEESSNQGIT